MGSHVVLVFFKQLYNIPTCSTISFSKEIYFVYSFVDFLTLNKVDKHPCAHILIPWSFISSGQIANRESTG